MRMRAGMNVLRCPFTVGRPAGGLLTAVNRKAAWLRSLCSSEGWASWISRSQGSIPERMGCSTCRLHLREPERFYSCDEADTVLLLACSLPALQLIADSACHLGLSCVESEPGTGVCAWA